MLKISRIYLQYIIVRAICQEPGNQRGYGEFNLSEIMAVINFY